MSKMKLLAFTSLLLTVLFAPTNVSQLADAFQDKSPPQPTALSSTTSRNIIFDGSKSSPGQGSLIYTTAGSCLNDCGTSHSDYTKDLGPLYRFCNSISDERACSQRLEDQTPSESSLSSSTVFPISASSPELLRQRSVEHPDERDLEHSPGDLEDNQDEDDIKLEADPQLSIFTNTTMQVRQATCGSKGSCDSGNYSNTCCGPQQDNCCLNVQGNCSAYNLCYYKWAFPCHAWCLLPSGGSSLQPPRILTIPGHILRSTILTLSSSSLRLFGIFSIPQSLFQSTLFTLSNAKSALAKQHDHKRDSIEGRNNTDCGPFHLVCLPGYQCQIVSKANYECAESGTSSLRAPRIFRILSRPIQIIITLLGSMKYPV